MIKGLTIQNRMRKNQYIGINVYSKLKDGVWEHERIPKLWARHNKDCVKESLRDEMLRSIGCNDIPAHQVIDVTDDLYIVAFRIQRGTMKEKYLLEKGFVELAQK